jgi:hypothetical protein
MQSTDYTKLDDPEFFEERRRVREQLERLPEQHADRAMLAELLEKMTDEFVKRAASAWQAS